MKFIKSNDNDHFHFLDGQTAIPQPILQTELESPEDNMATSKLIAKSNHLLNNRTNHDPVPVTKERPIMPAALKNVRPTFKEDPTGYLNQQTELLHNSISNLHSPNSVSHTQSSVLSSAIKLGNGSNDSSSSVSLMSSNETRLLDGHRQMIKAQIPDTGKRKHTPSQYHVVNTYMPSQSPSQSPVSSSTLTQRSTPETGRASTESASTSSSLHSPGEGTAHVLATPTIAPAPAIKQIVNRQRRIISAGQSVYTDDEPERLVITSNSQVVTVPKLGKTITSIQSHPQFIQHRDGQTTFTSVSRPSVMVHQSPQSIISTSADLHHNVFTSGNNNLQPIILSNSGNLIQSQQLLSPTSGATIVSQGPRLITANNQMHIINQGNHQTVLSPTGEQQLLSPTATGQTVILNTMPNSVIIQQQSNLLNGQIINSVPQDSTIVGAGGPLKKKLKKRRGDGTGTSSQIITQQTSQSAPSPGNTYSIQTQESQQPQIVQMASPLSSPSFQLSPSLPGLAIVPKAQQTQQILLPNGQTILQPVSLVSPTMGLQILQTCDPLVQLPNVTHHITSQGMVIRTQCPQQKQFLTPPATNQYIVNQNGQMSPIGQIYTTGMVQPTIINNQPQQIFTTGTATATGIVTQPQSLINVISNDNTAVQMHHKGSMGSVGRAPSQNSLPPPDTTTSPLSPDRPSSNRSGSYDGMVR